MLTQKEKSARWWKKLFNDPVRLRDYYDKRNKRVLQNKKRKARQANKINKIKKDLGL
jgi:hypothetical protein